MYNNDKIKVRKKHKCFGCCKTINAGDIANVTTQIDDSEMWNVYMCKNCVDHEIEKCKKCRACYDNETATKGFIKECKQQELIQEEE